MHFRTFSDEIDYDLDPMTWDNIVKEQGVLQVYTPLSPQFSMLLLATSVYRFQERVIISLWLLIILDMSIQTQYYIPLLTSFDMHLE